MKTLILIIFAAAALMAGCADPAANKPKAETAEPVSTEPIKIEVGQTDSTLAVKTKGTAIPIDPATSKIEFVGSKVTGKHEGGFRSFEGVIDLVNDKAVDSSVVVEIKMVSVFTDADGLTKHLQTGDFFEAEKFPISKFVSTK
ncbi:MAG: YceI family protein, partial [Pyrinomonadaceae bacterium]